MTEMIYSWVQDLVCYYILISAVLNFLPDNSYKKYIQYYMGLLFILVILSPLLKMTGIQAQVDQYVSEFQRMEAEEEQWLEKAKMWENDWQQEITIIEGQEVKP